MEFPIDAKTGKAFIPDAYDGKIEDRFKNLPRESELKKKKESKKEKPKTKKKVN